MTSPGLVTLAAAKTHLRITTPDDDPGDLDLQTKLDHATALVIDYCASTAWWRAVAATWTADTVPFVVTASILLELGELYRYRGDDIALEEGPRTDGEDLNPRVRDLLRRTRDPVVA